MTLATGTRLGPYEVLSAIGAGGMGEVYRARDTRLKRDVALKILPESFAADPERLARFQREAEVLASLNHPYIAGIHGLEESGDVQALVMELVEGPTLADRIADGAIPIDEALPIARQIAEALEAAHEQGIIHRDLKPANIKVRPDGTVKVLDFGLAKALEPTAVSSPHMSRSPTITTPAMTQAGVILGTAAYMSPEQAKGRPVDKRSDVWAFGCVLYEMLTGQRAFDGEDVSDTLAAVLKGEPDWDRLPSETPSSISVMLRRCLEKDRRTRIADISVAKFVIDEPTVAGQADSRGNLRASPGPMWRRSVPFVATAIVAGTLVGGVAWSVRPALTPPSITRFSFTLPEGQRFTNPGRPLVAISPDGTRIVYVAINRLYMRSISEAEPRPIQGTEDPQGVTSPAFSPDGQAIAFVSASDRAIKRIDVGGGVAVTICPILTSMGVNWGPDGIVFGQRGGNIMRVSPNGGAPELLVEVKDDEVASSPQLLPGGQAVLLSMGVGFGPEAGTGAAGSYQWDKARVVLQSLASGEQTTLIESGGDARYLPTGHIAYAVGGTLLAVPFDLERMQITGTAVPILEGVRRSEATGAAQFSVSNNGSLVYLPGPASNRQRSLGSSDRQGALEAFKVQAGSYESARVSPDGKWVALGADDGKAANIWLYDLTGASSLRQLTLDGRNKFPVWSADGQHLAFQSDREGDLAVFWQRADGSNAAERLTKPEQGTSHVPSSWSPDGKTLLFSITRASRVSLWTYSVVEKAATPFGGVESATEIGSEFSPDGRWIAYASAAESRSGQPTVFVQPFPSTGARYRISNGRQPMWSRDGGELFFAAGGPGEILVTRVTSRPTFAFGAPTPLRDWRFIAAGPNLPRPYDIAPDGKRFIGVLAFEELGVAPEIHVVQNWTEELKRLVPTR